MRTFSTGRFIRRAGHFFLALATLLLIQKESFSQTFAAHQNAPIGLNCNGYYDYLPSGYTSTGGMKHPLLIALHGEGELGNGNSQLSLLTNEGIPYLINQGGFPASVTVSSGTYSFVVFAPQFKVVPVIADVDAVVQFAINNYNIDPTRVYITGYSMGGGAVWEYTGYSAANGNLFAAAVPVCGAFLVAPDFAAARVIASDNLPIWATHNNGDPTVPYSNTTTMISYINQAPAPTPAAIMNTFISNTHDAWTATYDPATLVIGTGFNMYQWMLQYQARPGALPVVLSRYDVNLESNNEVLLDWTTTEEENNQYFTVERSADGIHFSSIAQVPALDLQTGSNYSYTDEHPLAGANYYRLSQTDRDAVTVNFSVKEVFVNTTDAFNISASPNPAGSSVFVKLNFPETGNLNLRIVNAAGIPVQGITINKSSQTWQQALPLINLSTGIYFIQVSGNNTKLSVTLLKQ